MLLKIAKSHQPVLLLVSFVLAIVLSLKGFIHPQWQVFGFDSVRMPLYEIITGYVKENSFSGRMITMTIMIILAFNMLRLNNKYILIPERTYLPTVFFILLLFSLIPLQRMNPVIFASLFLTYAIERILDSYRKDLLCYNFFDSSFLIALASLFYLNSVFFIIVSWIGLIIFRTFNWREWFYTFLGFGIPCLFLFSIYYITGRDYKPLLLTIQNNFKAMPVFVVKDSYLLLFCYIIFLIFISSYFIIRSLPGFKILSRKTFNLLFFCFMIGVLVYVLVSSASLEVMTMIVTPISFLLTFYFNKIKSPK